MVEMLRATDGIHLLVTDRQAVAVGRRTLAA
jgi:hypothetical protein